MDESETSSTAASAAKPTPRFPKQAIVVIHGMGEQKPMDTIRDFVRAAWETDRELHGNAGESPMAGEVWSKPDVRTGSLELRRITTRPSKQGVRADFYELYWADLSGGSTWGAVRDWIAGLLLRNPFTRVPARVRLAWILLWLAALAVMVLTIATALPYEASIGKFQLWDMPVLKWLRGFQTWQLGLATALLAVIIHQFVVPYFGRVVRYTRAEPENIAARKDIRTRGLQLLTELHQGEYQRIVIVGHSLGSIVAYDLLGYYWAQHAETHTVHTSNKDEFKALCMLEEAAEALDKKATKETIEGFRKAQTHFSELLRERLRPDTRWLITDLITLGSPLTHAEFLLANSADDLVRRKEAREFPTCPPVRERLDDELLEAANKSGLPATDGKLFCFPLNPKKPVAWQLHHAAPFAVVRWTNIHDPAVLVFCGDIISGELAPVFGRGVTDINLRKLRRRQAFRFTHTKYWWIPDPQKSWRVCWWKKPKTKPTPVPVEELRKAMDLAHGPRVITTRPSAAHRRTAEGVGLGGSAL